MAPQASRRSGSTGGSTNRGFATLDPERQGAPPRLKPVPPRSPGAQPPAPPRGRRADPEEAESTQEPR